MTINYISIKEARSSLQGSCELALACLVSASLELFLFKRALARAIYLTSNGNLNFNETSLRKLVASLRQACGKLAFWFG